MKKLLISKKVMSEIKANGQNSYPEEGAGLIFGTAQSGIRIAELIYPIQNSRDSQSRHNRYLITSRDMLNGEIEAEKLGFDVIGVFHSHPDHPAQPSEFDREWALPWYSYIITSVEKGEAKKSLSWRLLDNRTKFIEEKLELLNT